MFDKTISSTTAIAFLLWPLGLALVIVDLASTWDSGELGLLLAGAGGVMNIRGFFCGLERRERAAFELGQESVRSIR